jgi:hypothetical protein
MARTRPNPNILLVEGDDEKRVIPYLMDHHVVWGDKEIEWVVQIKSHEGIEDLLQPKNIEAEAMAQGRNAVGIVVDANDHFDSRWARVRHCCLGIAADFPESMPSRGLIHQNARGLRIGVWIMPDNQSRGMLETFLSHLIVPADAPLWAFAQESCARSRDHGASYTDSHRDKANIHTYPGLARSTGNAVARLGIRASLGCAAAIGRSIREVVYRSVSAHATFTLMS